MRKGPRGGTSTTHHHLWFGMLGTRGTLRILIQCSRGTYARVLAQDIATQLGTVGHLKELRRPRSGPFS